MAPAKDHEKRDLASRLVAAAEGIVNHAAAQGFERDLRDAAEMICSIGEPPQSPILEPASELARIAGTTRDADTGRLRRIRGEA